MAEIRCALCGEVIDSDAESTYRDPEGNFVHAGPIACINKLKKRILLLQMSLPKSDELVTVKSE
jgi:hypothetical protein